MKFNKIMLLGATILSGFAYISSANADWIEYSTDEYLGPDYVLENINAQERTYNTVVFVNGATVTLGDNSVIKGNKADIGGAFAVSSTAGSLLKIGAGTVFSNNEAYLDGGAIGNYGGAIIAENVTFENNTAQIGIADDPTPIGGGAISLDAASQTTINNGIFKSNTSGYNGGAIGTRLGNVADNSGAKLTVSAYFEGNHADSNGGALYNTFYSGENGVEVKGEFVGNTAGVSGGAIYNDGAKDYYQNDGGKMTISGSTFTSNESVLDGGAIFNSGDLTISSSVFDKNAASIEGLGGYGGAIFSNARGLNIDGTDFTNNTAYSGGAIYESRNSAYSSENADGMVISDSNFTSNHAASDAGAIGISKKATITNAVFTSNTAGLSEGGISATSDSNGGGAIYVMQFGQATLTNVEFYNNKSGAHGGAIGARHNSADGGFLSLTNATFDGNSADKGGAIASIYDGVVNIENATFTNNTAGSDGGAIYIGVDDNFGSTDGSSTPSTNGGTLNFSGLNTFSGNSDANGLNDIYNSGKINVLSGAELQLDGGISGTGSIVFEAGSKLQVNATTTEIANAVTTNGATLNMVFANAFEGEYQLVTGSVTDADFTIGANSLYDIVGKENELGTYVISKKSTEEIAENTGANANQSAALDAVLSGPSDNANFNQAADAVVGMLQNESTKAEGLEALSAMSVEAAPLVRVTQTNLQNQLFGVVSSRLTGGNVNANQGKSSGDSYGDNAMWVQGLVNHSKLDGQFDTDTNGLAFGVEKQVNNELKVGVAYALAKTDVDSYSRDTQIKTHSAMLYGEYKPSNWFVNGILSYSMSDYEEDKTVAGVNAEADYEANNISIQAVTGYEYVVNNYYVTPTIGLRYMNIDRDGYTDALGTNVDSNRMDILTAMLGVKFETDYTVNDWTFTPEVRAAVTYDLIHDDDNALITLANGAAYSVDTDNLKRFGYELGAGVKTYVNDEWELGIGYEGKFRQDYQDHTGLISAMYHF